MSDTQSFPDASSSGESWPAVTVLMAEYNTQPDYLRASLQSIVSQTFTNFELIIVDDGGDTDLDGIVADLGDPRIRIIRNPHNLGLVESLTRGVAEARTTWIARMDTDDIYEEVHLSTLIALARDVPGCAVYSSRAIEFSNDGSRIVVGKPGEKGVSQLVSRDTPIHPGTLLLKSAIVAVGGYPNYRRVEDWALWCELILAGQRIYVGDAPTCWHRVELDDYRKRRIQHRIGSIRAQLHYYPRLKVSLTSIFRGWRFRAWPAGSLSAFRCESGIWV